MEGTRFRHGSLAMEVTRFRYGSRAVEDTRFRHGSLWKVQGFVMVA